MRLFLWLFFLPLFLLSLAGALIFPRSRLGHFNPTVTAAIFNNQRLDYRPQDLLVLTTSFNQNRQVLGQTAEERWLEIDLSEQRLYAYEGQRLVYTFLISSGKWSPTPTGEFRVWIKVKYQRMTGGRRENNTFYDLPNVPFIQYFYKGYGLHGAYWHNNFGQPMSHGCVNLSPADAQVLYYWTSPSRNLDKGYVKPTADDPGTRILIHA